MIITSLTAGLVLIVIGALVWKFKMVALIAGRRPDMETDKGGLANWIGKNMIIMGVVVWVFAAIQMAIFKDTNLIVDSVIILILATRMAMGAAKFSKPIGKQSKKAIARAKKKGKI